MMTEEYVSEKNHQPSYDSPTLFEMFDRQTQSPLPGNITANEIEARLRESGSDPEVFIEKVEEELIRESGRWMGIVD